jgi:hypothetical protein
MAKGGKGVDKASATVSFNPDVLITVISFLQNFIVMNFTERIHGTSSSRSCPSVDLCSPLESPIDLCIWNLSYIQNVKVTVILYYIDFFAFAFKMSVGQIYMVTVTKHYWSLQKRIVSYKDISPSLSPVRNIRKP